MVTNATSFSRSGLTDWLVQRLSAVVLGAYMLCILGSFVVHPDMDYEQWRALFAADSMRIFSLLSLAALCAHAWIGMWTVGTDYLTSLQFGKGATSIRLAYQAICILLIAVYLIWGIRIFWGT
ncbi:MAG: succinate dehydrogenase, hydrophobic membrane anchor protein [Gammaproteobacteria bacterium]